MAVGDPVPGELDVRLVSAGAWIEESVRVCADLLRAALAERGRITFGVSGGSTPTPVFDRLAAEDLAWEWVTIVQVDERCAPLGDAARNLTDQQATLGRTGAEWLELPVGDDGAVPDEADLDRFASRLAERIDGGGIDVVQLGLGADGHTASLVPGDPVLEVRDRPVAVTADYQGHPRVTLTYPTLERAGAVVWLLRDVGGSKADAFARLRSGDRSIPAGRLDLATSICIATE